MLLISQDCTKAVLVIWAMFCSGQRNIKLGILTFNHFVSKQQGYSVRSIRSTLRNLLLVFAILFGRFEQIRFLQCQNGAIVYLLLFRQPWFWTTKKEEAGAAARTFRNCNTHSSSMSRLGTQKRACNACFSAQKRTVRNKW